MKNVNRGRGRKNAGLAVGMGVFLAASLLWGCGFRGYEHVQTAEQENAAAKAPAASGEAAAAGDLRLDTGGEQESSSSPVIEILAEQADPGSGEETGADGASETPEAAEAESSAKSAGTAEADTAADGTAVLLFGGDVYLSDHVLQAYRAAGGISGVLDEGYRAAVRDADLFFVNEEFPFSARGTAAADKQYTFRLDPSNIRMFQEMGIGGVTLANNHALDFGTEALLDSCSVLDGAGIPHTGAGENLEAARQAARYEIGGKKIAVIGASRVFPAADWAAGASHAGMLTAYDPAVLISEIRSLKETQDVVIAYVHWGVERAEQPNEVQKNLGRQLIDAGADLVIGAHPHVLQGIEYYNGKPIVYSLGNFVFGSSIPRTALLEVTVGKDGVPVGLRLIPGTSAAGFTRTLTGEAERRSFFDYMQDISFGIVIDDGGNILQP